MKFSKKALRIRRKHFSTALVILFIGLGLIVTYILNTQLTRQQQITKSRADVSPEQECSYRSYDYCERTGGTPWACTWVDGKCYLSGTEPEIPPQQNEGVCNKPDQSCCSDGDTDYCNGGLSCEGNVCVQPEEPGDVGGQGYCEAKGGTCFNSNTQSCTGEVLRKSDGYECDGTSNVICCTNGDVLNKGGGSEPDPGDDPPVGGPGPQDPAPVKKPPPPPPGADDPKGVVDQNDGHTIRGWAFDPNDTDKSLEIHIYIYPEGGEAEGNNIGVTTIDRSDVNDSYGIHGYHGFDWKVPDKWCNGTSYTADVFAINLGAGGTTTLGGSTWRCSGGGQDPIQVEKPNGMSERDALIKKNFDGRWYLSNNIDVRKDKGYGKNSDTAFDHYLAHGMSEKRNPNANFDEKYYLDSNPDVAAVVPQDALRSGFEHYLIHGQKPPECRKPKSDLSAPPPCGSKDDAEIKSNSSADIALSLEGIGPGANIKNPVRSAKIKIFSSADQLGAKTKDVKGAAIHTASDILTYDKVSGNFVNHNFKLGTVTPGKYQLVVQMDTYLDRQLLGADGSKEFTLGEGKISTPVSSKLTAGDSSPLPGGDNNIDIIDYNSLLGCINGGQSATCKNKRSNDINDDGKVDQKDLDIIEKNMGDEGFLLEQDGYKCESNPACDSGKNSIQMCALLCTKKTERI